MPAHALNISKPSGVCSDANVCGMCSPTSRQSHKGRALTRVEENGSFQVGVFLGTQVQAPKGVEAALQPLHGSQSGLRPLGLLSFALAIEEDLLKHAGGRGLHHLEGHHLLDEPQEEKRDPAAVQQQELILSWQQVEGREVFHEADGFYQHVGGCLAGDVGCAEADGSALVAEAALVGWAVAAPVVVEVLAEEGVEDGGALVVAVALAPLTVHVHAAGGHNCARWPDPR